MPSQSLLPAPEGQTNHGASLIDLPDGRLLACWYSGSSEAHADSRILCSDSGDGGGTWGAARVVVDRGERAKGAGAANKSVGNVTLHHDALGRLWMIYGVIQRWDWPILGNMCRNWLCGRVDAKLSIDDGAIWSPATRFDDQTGALPRAKPLRVDGLGDVVPLYLEGDERSFVRIIDLSRVSDGRVPAGRLAALGQSGLIQPSLVRQADGSLRAFLRDTGRQWIHTATLDPVSGQWGGAIPTNLPNPGSAVDAFLDDNERFVLIYNPSTTDRRALRLASSADGVRFRPGCDLVAPGSQGEVAYPTVIRDAQGVWHIVYSSDDKRRIRHIAFDAAWLRSCLGE